MRAKQSIIFLICLTYFGLTNTGCVKRPYKVDYKTVEGIVIARENCKTDSTAEYWIIDFNVDAMSPQIGDSINLSGQIFTNALKVKGLSPRSQYIGKKALFDYKEISSEKIKSSGCQVTPSTTYDLRELFFINQAVSPE